MTTRKTKTINFKVENIDNLNKIMGQNGTLYVEAIINAVDINEKYGVEYDGIYTLKWSSLFSKNKPHSIPTDSKNKILELFYNSKFNESEAFALAEHTVHNLSYFQNYSITYMMSHDCEKVESFIAIVTKHIVDTEIISESLSTKIIDELLSKIEIAFYMHEGIVST